jgi:hypothetical protein
MWLSSAVKLDAVGKTLVATFLDARPMTKQKMIAANPVPAILCC